jgi:protein O-GlcNAcase/histone acetyltransferase
LACVLAALKANGSHGVYCQLNGSEKHLLEFYSKLGFAEVQVPPDLQDLSSRDLFMGRSI